MKHRRYNINNRRKMALVLLQRKKSNTSDIKQKERIQSEIETLQSRIR